MKVKQIKDWGFFWKLIGFVVIAVLPIILLIVFYIMPTLKDNLLEEKQTATKNVVNVVTSIIKNYDQKVTSSQLTVDEAKKLALEEIKHLRYAGEEYFWINDLYHKMIMHPFKPELDGKDVSDNQDPNGVYIFREFVNIVKKENSGFLHYMWSKPGHAEPVPKISYVELYEKWGWVIGSGIYVDDVEEEFASISRNILLIVFILLAVVLAFSNFVAKKLIRPIKLLKEAANRVAVGDAEFVIEAKTKDEFGDLESAFGLMLANIKEQSAVADDIASGKLDITINAKSKNDILAHSLAKVVSTLRNLVNDLKLLTQAALNGDLGKRANAKTYQGGYSEIVEGINKTLDAIINPIKEGSSVLEVMATGDLTVRVEGEYNGDHQIIKNSINKLGDSLSKVIEDVTGAIQATASAANEISSSTEQMAAGSQEQSAQTTEIASAVEEMTKTIYETSRNAGEASKNAKTSSNQAQLGVQKIKESVVGMDRITESAKSTGAIIGSLANKTDQIGEIAQVIDDIADQTNLLALNAAIEAARAGEQGRGFAVVADEVRKLAERTTKATKEIADTIKAIQKEAKEADNSMVQARESVGNGIDLTKQVEEVLLSIFDSVQNLSGQIDQVAAASEEQSSASEQISKNIEAISSVAHESASGIQQVARAAEDLNQLTVNLQNIISRFTISSNLSSYAVRKNGKLVMA
ncbi:MAG: methyl-accepting chemotaxis protein [Bacteroidota bacterium]